MYLKPFSNFVNKNINTKTKQKYVESFVVFPITSYFTIFVAAKRARVSEPYDNV